MERVIPSRWSVFWLLVKTNWMIFKRKFGNDLIDHTIWVVCVTVVSGYLMPSFGLSDNFAVFMLPAMLASTGLFRVFTQVMRLVNDFEKDRLTDYYFTLPINSFLVLLAQSIFYSISSASVAIFVLPLGKLFLFNRVSLLSVNWPLLAILFICTYLFFGLFSLVIASFTLNMDHAETVWMRFVFPLWYLGGFNFSWQILYRNAPILGYLDLLNPVIYITEGLRGAFLNSSDFLNPYICLLMICCFAIFSGFLGIYRLKKRLDFV